MIWVYDRLAKTKFRTNIKNIAHETNLYTEELESNLAIKIEQPANVVLDKIRQHQNVTIKEKRVLARYLITLWKRVPKGKDRIKKNMPQISKEVGQGIKNEIDRLITEQPELLELGKKRKIEVEYLLKKYEQSPPEHIWHYVINPKATEKAIDMASKMCWRYLCIDNNSFFLSSDNPIFFFEWEGIANPTSELSFPISSKIALWATWRTDLPEGYIKVKSSFVKEINRRTVQNSKRFVFSPRDENWISGFVSKNSWRLNRVR